MHDGAMTTLEEIGGYYNRNSDPDAELWPVGFSGREAAAACSFLRTLSSGISP
jgi:hypothetical protein